MFLPGKNCLASLTPYFQLWYFAFYVRCFKMRTVWILNFPRKSFPLKNMSVRSNFIPDVSRSFKACIPFYTRRWHLHVKRQDFVSETYTWLNVSWILHFGIFSSHRDKSTNDASCVTSVKEILCFFYLFIFPNRLQRTWVYRIWENILQCIATKQLICIR